MRQSITTSETYLCNSVEFTYKFSQYSKEYCTFVSHGVAHCVRQGPETQSPTRSATITGHIYSTPLPTATMPTQSTISSADKSCIKSILPNSTYKIITATLARIYYAHPSPNKWSYTGLQGGLVFVRDTKTGAHWFKLCDLQGTRGVLWDCEMPLEEEYAKDRGFFHSFAGDVSTFTDISVYRSGLMLSQCPRTA